MASEIYNVIDALSREKGIDPQIVVSAVEDAIVLTMTLKIRSWKFRSKTQRKSTRTPRLAAKCAS